MNDIILTPLEAKFAEEMFKMTQNPNVTKHLNFHNKSIYDVMDFINQVKLEEEEGVTISRAILAEEDRFIGITSLLNINHTQKQAEMITWIDEPGWGKGYNEEAKRQILMLAFGDLELERVFLGTRKSNIRSLKAQQKLGYVTIDVGSLYVNELKAAEQREQSELLLSVIEKEHFYQRHDEAPVL